MMISKIIKKNLIDPWETIYACIERGPKMLHLVRTLWNVYYV